MSTTMSTLGPDVLTGTDGRDTLSGLAGNDILRGLAENDILSGDAGDDILRGGDGNDTLRGYGDDDTLTGGNDNDRLIGYAGDDNLQGEEGNDTLTGGADNDTLWGNSGEDEFRIHDIFTVIHLDGVRYQVTSLLHGVDEIKDLIESDGDGIYDRGVLHVIGRASNDTNSGATSGVLTGGKRPVSIDFENPPFDFSADSETLTLKTARSTQSVEPDQNTQRFSRSPGFEITTLKKKSIDFRLRSTTSEGQEIDGNETVVLNITPTSSFKFTSEVVYAFQSEQALQSVPIKQNPKVGFSQVTIVSLDDDFPSSSRQFGDKRPNKLLGGRNDDALFGFAGNDIIFGQQGADNISGGAGADRLRGEDGTDALYGNSGRDFVDGGAGDDTINGGEGSDILRGGDGNDNVIGWTGNDRIIGNLGNDLLKGEYGDDTVVGGAGNDSLSGGFGANILEGGAGQDWVFEYGTDFILTDTLLSGLGKSKLVSIESASLTGLNSDDRIDASRFSNGDVHLFGAGGDDTLLGGRHNDSLQGDAGNDLLVGGAGDDTLNGSTGVDTIFERATTDLNLTDTTLVGQGSDSISNFEKARLFGNAGNNTLRATTFSGDVYASAGSGNDRVFGSVTGDDTLHGGAGHDKIYGYGGMDRLTGSSGNDILWGGLDNDTLTGGSGSDTFWMSNSNQGVDTITDFSNADIFRVNNSGFNPAGGANDLVNGVTSPVNGLASLGADSGFRYFSGSGNLYFDSNGAGFVGSTLIANFSNTPSLATLNNNIQVT